jgi:hypothetical protein
MIKKLKKQKKISLRRLQKLCDRELQEAGRRIYSSCLVCGKPMSCLHHFYPKSMSSNLRYDWENCVPLCVGDHFSHHNGNPDIHSYVIKIKGEQWLCDLKAKRSIFVKPNRQYYEEILRNLKKINK